jgi:hypothetical protein
MTAHRRGFLARSSWDAIRTLTYEHSVARGCAHGNRLSPRALMMRKRPATIEQHGGERLPVLLAGGAPEVAARRLRPRRLGDALERHSHRCRPAGGIPLQLEDGVGGYLVESVEQCAARTVELLRDPRRAAKLGAAGRDRVRERFLITRLLGDELRLLNTVLGPRTRRLRRDRPRRRKPHPSRTRRRRAGRSLPSDRYGAGR